LLANSEALPEKNLTSGVSMVGLLPVIRLTQEKGAMMRGNRQLDRTTGQEFVGKLPPKF
jgi:hypothetical protein